MQDNGKPGEWEMTKGALMWVMRPNTPLSIEIWTEATCWPRKAPRKGFTILFGLCQNLVVRGRQFGGCEFRAFVGPRISRKPIFLLYL